MNSNRLENRGFTLVELLVIVSIIGLLSTLAITSLDNSRRKARDAKRKMDLKEISTAFELYYDKNNTYRIPGTGWSGDGYGWFNYQDGAAYTLSIARGLENAECIGKAPRDPSITTDNERPQYMVYRCGNGVYFYAQLELPSAEDLQTYTLSKALGCQNLDTYGMNYAFGHK